MQAWGTGMLVGAVDERHAVVVEHAEMADEWLEAVGNPVAATIASTSTGAAVGEHRPTVLEVLEPRDDLHRPVLHRRDQADVDDRNDPPAQELGVRLLRRGKSDRREVAELSADPSKRGRDAVDDADRETAARDAEQLARDAQRVTADDGGRRPQRQQHLARAGASVFIVISAPELPAPTTSTRCPR